MIAAAAHRRWKLVSRDAVSARTIVHVADGVDIGGESVHVFAGPCTVEGRNMTIDTARWVKANGATILRGGAFKPSTSPYSFQGMGEQRLEILAEAGAAAGLPVVTEVMDTRNVTMVAAYADVLQIGSRNMHNFDLLKEVAKTGKPVLLKRGLSATIDEWLFAAEYICAGGNPNVILCERGIRTFEPATRNTLDLNAVPLLKELTHLPMVVDPSHGTGKTSLVTPMAKASLAAGADGLIVEVHPDPSVALKDGFQSLDFDAFAAMMSSIRPLAAVLSRPLQS